MQSAKHLTIPDNTPVLNRVSAQSAAAAARRTKRITALDEIAPELDRLAQTAKAGGLGLIGYFLDMAIYEVTRERDQLKDKV